MNFRTKLMATTLLAGLAVFAADVVQAGPNGPNISVAPNISSMRVEFGRLGSPGTRALAPEDRRTVSINVKKPTKKAGIIMPPVTPKDGKEGGKKNSAVKIDIARASNPKPVTGGKGQQDVGNERGLVINPAIQEILTVTGGNPEAWAQFANLPEWLRNGPLTVANPLMPGNGGFVFPGFFPGQPSQPETPASDGFLNGWPGATGAPGGPDTSKAGWASGDAWRLESVERRGNTTTTVYYNKETETRHSRTVTESENPDTGESSVRTHDLYYGSGGMTIVRTMQHYDAEGNPAGGSSSTEVYLFGETTITAGEDSQKEDAPKEKAEKEKDSQPVAEGAGSARPTRGWCSPTGGCYAGSTGTGGPRIIPSEGEVTSTAGGQAQQPAGLGERSHILMAWAAPAVVAAVITVIGRKTRKAAMNPAPVFAPRPR